MQHVQSKGLVHLGLVAVCLLFWIGAVPAALASVEEGAQPKKWPANPAKHKVTIERKAANDLEKRMIAAAEAAPPSKPAGAEGTNAVPKGWSHRDIQGVKIPYALTGEAVEYYAKFVRDSQGKSFTRYIEPSSRFNYEASVTKSENFALDGKTLPLVYIVKMKASFDESFVAGGTEAVQFNKEREVVLDPEGKVLRVTGDGETEAPVLAI